MQNCGESVAHPCGGVRTHHAQKHIEHSACSIKNMQVFLVVCPRSRPALHVGMSSTGTAHLQKHTCFCIAFLQCNVQLFCCQCAERATTCEYRANTGGEHHMMHKACVFCIAFRCTNNLSLFSWCVFICVRSKVVGCDLKPCWF